MNIKEYKNTLVKNLIVFYRLDTNEAIDAVDVGELEHDYSEIFHLPEVSDVGEGRGIPDFQLFEGNQVFDAGEGGEGLAVENQLPKAGELAEDGQILHGASFDGRAFIGFKFMELHG